MSKSENSELNPQDSLSDNNSIVNECPVCHDVENVFAVGNCNHHICYRCSVRMRFLCNQLYCPICRSDVKQVAFIDNKNSFQSLDLSSFCLDSSVMIFSQTQQIQNLYKKLLMHNCKKCGQELESFVQLQIHMSKHQLYCCKLCVKHLKLFSFERKFYTRQQLIVHKKEGDADDKSYKGHPLCEFCDQRYFDNDELVSHLRKDHFFCHFCEADGVTGEFYCKYENLREHFKDQHYLCERGSCKDAQWSNAFKNEMDLKAHIAKSHSIGLDKQQTKQLRNVEVDFNYSRNENSRRGARGGMGMTRENERIMKKKKERSEMESAQALSMALNQVHRQGQISLINHELHRAIQSSSNRENTNQQETVVKIQSQSNLLNSEFPDLYGNLPTSKSIPNTSKSYEESNIKTTANSSKTPLHHPSTFSSSISSCSFSSSMANKLAYSARMSVRSGNNFQSEFPSLSSNEQPKKTPINSVWISKKTDNSSLEKKSNQQTKQNKKEPFNFTEKKDDFPNLIPYRKNKTNGTGMEEQFKHSASFANLQNIEKKSDSFYPMLYEKQNNISDKKPINNIVDEKKLHKNEKATGNLISSQSAQSLIQIAKILGEEKHEEMEKNKKNSDSFKQNNKKKFNKNKNDSLKGTKEDKKKKNIIFDKNKSSFENEKKNQQTSEDKEIKINKEVIQSENGKINIEANDLSSLSSIDINAINQSSHSSFPPGFNLKPLPHLQIPPGFETTIQSPSVISFTSHDFPSLTSVDPPPGFKK